MESPQSVVSPLKTSPTLSDSEKQNLDLFTKNPSLASKKTEIEPSLGVLEVCVHQARNIQNICIYQKQDVYAKICITSNPEKFVTTQTINGGGQNPIFNETLQINVTTIDSSLKCEIYMLSRVKNYLEDQLLGFTLIPLSEILIENGKLEKEFTLSSDDLFHSPSGFVHLSLSYTGASPDVIAIPPPAATNGAPTDSELAEIEKIEFPDPKIANENHMMVSEYFGLSSESESSDTPSPRDSNSANQEHESPLKQKPTEGGGGEGDSSGDPIKKAIVAVTIEPEQKVVQQDFVDLYMKSMQQFTESLAKMKLPLDVEKEQTDSGNSSSDGKIQTPKSAESRVFYGSRAFF